MERPQRPEGGDNIGLRGQKKVKADKAAVLCNGDCNVIAPLAAAVRNRHESPLRR